LENLHHTLKTLDHITLAEMDGVKLMDRTDTKFTFSREKLDKVLAAIHPYYKVLEVEGKRLSHYKTLYYDTSDYSLYLAHHNGELNRYKVRHRTYVDSGLGFLEVKFKNNKGRTQKKRIEVEDAPLNWNDTSKDFLQAKTPLKIESLIPSIWVNYGRITLVNRTCAERVTIDVDLEFISHNKLHSFNNLVIAEVKQDKKNPSQFLKLMKALRIREGSISKYCMGVAVSDTPIKKNNFKEKLLAIKHIIA
jgi:hypothetical protein